MRVETVADILQKHGLKVNEGFPWTDHNLHVRTRNLTLETRVEDIPTAQAVAKQLGELYPDENDRRDVAIYGAIAHMIDLQPDAFLQGLVRFVEGTTPLFHLVREVTRRYNEITTNKPEVYHP